MGMVPTIVALAHCIQSSLGNCGAGAGKNSGLERHWGGMRVSGPSPGKPRVGSNKVDTQLVRGALVDPVSYGQQSTTEGSWRDVEKEVEEMKDTTQRSAGRDERFLL